MKKRNSYYRWVIRAGARFAALIMLLMMVICWIIPAILGGSKPNDAVITVEESNPPRSDLSNDYSGLVTLVNQNSDHGVGNTPALSTLYTEEDVVALAKMAWGEALVTKSDTEMAASMWCVLNRYDSNERIYTRCGSIYEIITQNKQFHGYKESNPVDGHLLWLARDVLKRWEAEKNGEINVGRVLPPEFLYFTGDGEHNEYTTEYKGGEVYDWHLESPYES